MAEENRIIRRTTPSIKPTILEYVDFESDKSKNQIIDGEVSRFTQRKGLFEPVVVIGTNKLAPNMLKALTIFQNDVLPTCTITFVDNGKIFTSAGYPLANIIAGVYVQSSTSKLKSMAADFFINSISSMPIPNTTSIMYTIGGELHIPKINGYYSKAYRNMTSVKIMRTIADELNLGFADNQPEDTNDSMTWLLPNYSYKDLIAHISKYAYKDDNCFFDAFVDRYYNLTFVNVEKQFARDPEIEQGYMAFDQTIIDKTRERPNPDEDLENPVPIVLTNHPNQSQTEFFISDYSLLSNHGDILKTHALRTYTFWYDHASEDTTVPVDQDARKKEMDEIQKTYNSKNFIMHFSEPLTNTITNDGKMPQTVTIPAYNSIENSDFGPDISTGNWVGINYHNAHESYKFADLINHHNRLETEKNMLAVTLPGFNVNVIRGSRVKVNIYMDKQSAMMANVMKTDEEDEEGTILRQGKLGIGEELSDANPGILVEDNFLTDFYYVKDVQYSYVNGKYQTSMTLSRRHWMLPLPPRKNLIS